MKILYDHGIFIGQKHGGISRYFTKIATRIAEADDTEVEIFAGANINEYLHLLSNSNIKVTGHANSIANKSFKLRKILSTLQSVGLASKHSILHHTYYYPELRKSLAQTSTLTVYDMIHEKIMNQSPKEIVPRLKKKSIAAVPNIISISESTKRDLVEVLDIDPNRITVIHLGAELDSIPGKVQICPDPYVLYVGQRGGYKNFTVLLKAFAASEKVKSNFKLVVFGGEALSQAENYLITELKITDRLLFVRGDDSQLKRAYMDASVFVYPSLYEGFGIPPLEAMGCGCPVIVSNISSLPEVVGDAGLYFEPSDVDNLVFQLESCLYGSKLRNDLVRRGIERSKSFTWDKCAQETYDYYKKILSRPFG